MKINLQHKQAAHCENGVTSNLLHFYNIPLSEPMVFGIGAGLFFSHMPFIKLNFIPVTSFRPLPGFIFKRVTRRLGIKTKRFKYSNPQQAMNEMDLLLEKGIPVGMLVGVFYLSYFPQEFRFHFNAHNLVVFGKENNTYFISDPVMENVETLTYDELAKVRFAKGTYPPKGRMYYISEVPEKIDLKGAIVKGIKQASKDMLTIPIPMFGVKGIRFMAKRLKRWPEKLGEKKAALYLGQVIRMLEEIGTGGAGFRFIYAAFLQEAAGVLEQPWLLEVSKEMTIVGDKWREFAYLAARTFKKRGTETATYEQLSELLMIIANQEEEIFKKLKKISL
ncbi:MAG: peptidase [Bacteroidetes bacterium CG2_30_32_10]|nr:MAG: peptidase [Bacteroidetes bacterium CG2_30_32_10]